MIRLITSDPDICQDTQPEGKEYGYSVFEELPNISMIRKVSPKANITLNEVSVSSADYGMNFMLNITNEMLCHLQQDDFFCKRIMGLLKSSKLQANNPYYIEDKLLIRNIIDNKQCFCTMVLPRLLITQILRAAHDELHTSTYIACL